MIQKRQQKDLEFLLPLLTQCDEMEFEFFVLFQTVTTRHAMTALPPLLDADVADAASTAAASLETAGKGIIYEHRAGSVPAQRLVEEFKREIARVHERPGGASRAILRKVVTALRSLERAARTAATSLEGDEAPVYLGLARRMTEQFAEHARTAKASVTSPSDEEPRLILP